MFEKVKQATIVPVWASAAYPLKEPVIKRLGLPVQQCRRLVFCDDNSHLFEAVDHLSDAYFTVLVLIKLGKYYMKLLLMSLEIGDELFHVQVTRVAHVRTTQKLLKSRRIPTF